MRNEIQDIKELIVFYDIINHLPMKKTKSQNIMPEPSGRIPVILSSDDNYSCFVATTGASILYNTNSFIEFYILSDGITEKNKKLIEETFKAITDNFSVNFVEVNAKEHFSQIQLDEECHIKINTCNRLLFPQLVPNVSRAIYLDVDLIVMGDIKTLWDEDLEGNVFGAVALIDRNSALHYFKKHAKIPQEDKYLYLNSGVLLIDYDKWRNLKGTNAAIVKDLFEVLKTTDAEVTPDEVILNKFAYLNGGYKVLPYKYNVCTYYSYKYLKHSKKLSVFEEDTLKDYETCLKATGCTAYYNQDEKPVIRHFYGHEKPWLCIGSQNWPIPITENQKDFWFYASLTPYYEDIKKMFLYKHVRKSIEIDTDLKDFYTNMWQRIFSIRNIYIKSKLFKVITICGIRIKIKKRNK